MTYTATAAVRTVSPLSGTAEVERIEALIEKHMPLVRRIAWHVHGRMASSVELEELIQTGMVALIEAARAFEDRGFPFTTYASTRIKGAMIDALRRASRQTRSAAANRRALASTRRILENRLCRHATASELAEEMGLSLEAFHQMEALSQTACEIDLESVYQEDDLAFQDLGSIGEDAIDSKTARDRLTIAIGELPEREKMVLQLYFFEELNLLEIGEILGVSAGRVCQIKAGAITRIRETLSECQNEHATF